ncbi:MAG: phosphatidylserine decarboxylase, partial [Burkholderiales bacterium]|nr:phosphatidylserine decarboxylase [Burkholderiales bacterium]
HAIDTLFSASYRGETTINCAHRVEKGQELGWFEHGSTIIVFAPKEFSLHPDIQSGARIRMGQALMNMPSGRVSNNGAVAQPSGVS